MLPNCPVSCKTPSLSIDNLSLSIGNSGVNIPGTVISYVVYLIENQTTSTTAADTPAAGTPAAGTPAAGTPPTGTPAAGTPPTGTPAAGTPPTGTPAASTTAADTPATGTPAAGTPAASITAASITAASTPAASTPAAGTPAAGTPATGTPAAGTTAASTPATGTPATGTPATDTPATGTPPTGTPAAGTTPTHIYSANLGPAPDIIRLPSITDLQYINIMLTYSDQSIHIKSLYQPFKDKSKDTAQISNVVPKETFADISYTSSKYHSALYPTPDIVSIQRPETKLYNNMIDNTKKGVTSNQINQINPINENYACDYSTRYISIVILTILLIVAIIYIIKHSKSVYKFY
jgi:hypothetical protein